MTGWGVCFTHGQEGDQFPKVDRAFSLLGLWPRSFAAGFSLCSFRLPHFLKLVDVKEIAGCQSLTLFVKGETPTVRSAATRATAPPKQSLDGAPSGVQMIAMGRTACLLLKHSSFRNLP